MPVLPVADVKPGTELQQPVHSPRGVLLAASGTVLTQEHLATFVAYGVRTINVAAPSDKVPFEPRQLDEERLAAVQAHFDARFAPAMPLSPLMREVRRVAEEMYIKKLLQQEDLEAGADR
ncbi:MAG TPA: hypothetical protein VFE42_24400 [Chloroflexota bacterium]|nr:hypothetical protein [Chloroflexota bacterium]